MDYSNIKILVSLYQQSMPPENIGLNREQTRLFLIDFMGVNIAKSTLSEYIKHLSIYVEGFNHDLYSRGFDRESILIIAVYKCLIQVFGMSQALDKVNTQSQEALKWLQNQ